MGFGPVCEGHCQTGNGASIIRAMIRRFALGSLALAAALGCVTPAHHVRRMGSRRAPRAETCTPESLPLHNDHGPEGAREAFAVVTAECGESKEPECRQQLLLGGCEAEADALIDVTSRVAQGRRRMFGTAVEYVSDSTAPRSSGGATTP